MKPSSDILELNSSVLEQIGNTSLLELQNIVPKDHARKLIKLESENPTGSMKDRMALAMIEAAEKDGRLKSGGRVVEYTGAVPVYHYRSFVALRDIRSIW